MFEQLSKFTGSTPTQQRELNVLPILEAALTFPYCSNSRKLVSVVCSIVLSKGSSHSCEPLREVQLDPDLLFVHELVTHACLGVWLSYCRSNILLYSLKI